MGDFFFIWRHLGYFLNTKITCDIVPYDVECRRVKLHSILETTELSFRILLNIAKFRILLNIAK